MSESEKTILALDAHGGDRGLDVSVPGAIGALEQDARLRLILVGDREALERVLDARPEAAKPATPAAAPPTRGALADILRTEMDRCDRYHNMLGLAALRCAPESIRPEQVPALIRFRRHRFV